MSKSFSSINKDIFLKMASYCAYQERCISEVKTKLVALGVRGYEVDEYIALLEEENYLSEERFATLFAGSKFRLKKWGKMKISQALMQKGVSDIHIHTALEEIEEQDYVDTLHSLLRKKWNTLPDSLELFKKKGKVFNYGVSKGYEPNYIWQIIGELEQETLQ